jgi:hypothetical protein
MATYLGKQKIGVIVPVQFGGEYDVESIKLEDGTQHLKITTNSDALADLNTNIVYVKQMDLFNSISGVIPLSERDYTTIEIQRLEKILINLTEGNNG